MAGGSGAFDHMFKLLIIGDSGVGKSALMTRFAEDLFTGTYISTIGVDFKIRTLKVDGETVRLQIWDTAGQERFKTITTTFYRGTHGVLVVYDITRMESFIGVKQWLQEIEMNCDSNIERILVGNKSDRQDSVTVPASEGQRLASELNVPFIETSAKDNVNVDQMFSMITQNMLAAVKSQANKKMTRPSTASDNVRVRPRSQSQSTIGAKPKCC